MTGYIVLAIAAIGAALAYALTTHWDRQDRERRRRG
mgnify:CR=1 FL=1